jgi:hypothetical protein
MVVGFTPERFLGFSHSGLHVTGDHAPGLGAGLEREKSTGTAEVATGPAVDPDVHVRLL